MQTIEKAGALARRFVLPEGDWRARPFGNGHINETFLLEAEGREERFILQWLNGYVFPRPDVVMANIAGVTEWLRARIAEEGGDPERETLRLVPALEGGTYVQDGPDAWRVFPFIGGTVSFDLPGSEAVFEETGRGFGRFARRLSGYPAETLGEAIPGFHDTPARYAQLAAAAREDRAGRLKDVGPEMEFCRARGEACGALLSLLREGRVPLRVTHNDTKVNNLLLDGATGRALCVIDLDTVMPGLAAYDFGDAIRTGASTAAEDERDLSKVSLSLPMYAAFARGYLSEAGRAMGREEILSLPRGAVLMTLENGLRFLADHLNGDVYFRVHREGQNLDRARAQFALVRDMEGKLEEMRRLALEAAGEAGVC